MRWTNWCSEISDFLSIRADNWTEGSFIVTNHSERGYNWYSGSCCCFRDVGRCFFLWFRVKLCPHWLFDVEHISFSVETMKDTILELRLSLVS